MIESVKIQNIYSSTTLPSLSDSSIGCGTTLASFTKSPQILEVLTFCYTYLSTCCRI